jgi:hypothetical protein
MSGLNNEREVRIVSNVLLIEPVEKYTAFKRVLGLKKSSLERITFFCDFLLIDNNSPECLNRTTGKVEGYNMATIMHLHDTPFFVDASFILYKEGDERLEFERWDNGAGNIRMGNRNYLVLPRIRHLGIAVETMPKDCKRSDFIDYMFNKEIGRTPLDY